MMSSSLSDQKSSAKTLRQLTKQYPLSRDLFSNEAVSKLLEPLDVPDNASLDLDLQLDIITTVFNISLPQGNKKVVAENLRVIPLLINALRTGTSQTKSNAAAALFRLSELDLNRTLIHESDALGSLICLVREGNSETMTDICAAMYMLCWDGANTVAHREKAVSDGAVRVILRKVKDGDFLDLLLPVLATLSNLPSAAEEMGKMGVVACLHKIMESGDKDSNAVKSCAAILRNICSYDKDELKEIANSIKGFIDAATIASPDRGYLDSLLDNMMSSSLSDQKSSAETLRWLTDEYPPMYILCRGPITHTYGEKAVSDDALRLVLRKVKDGAFLDLLLPVLATLSRLPSAAGEMARMGAVACLLKIMRKRGNTDNNAVESCAAILFDICSNDKDELKEVKQEEAANGTISTVAQRGTQRARRKAIEILEMGNNVG
ncbi:hypothetical protein C3L33_15291, partial [Rhododendron williamsianum]